MDPVTENETEMSAQVSLRGLWRRRVRCEPVYGVTWIVFTSGSGVA